MTALLGVELAGRAVLVVGGGPVAARRAQALADEGALVRLTVSTTQTEAVTVEFRVS